MKERLLINNEEDTDGRASVTAYEEQVLYRRLNREKIV